MKIKFILYTSCLLVFTSLGVFPIQQILGQKASPASPEPNTVPGSLTEPSSTPTASPSPTPTAVPVPTTTPSTIPTSSHKLPTTLR